MKLETKINEEDWQNEQFVENEVQILEKVPEGTNKNVLLKTIEEQYPEYITPEGKVKPNNKTGYFYGYGYIITIIMNTNVEVIDKEIYRTKNQNIQGLISDYTRALEKTVKEGKISI